MMDSRSATERLASLKQVLKSLEDENPRPRAGYAAREIRELRREIASVEKALRK